MSTSPCGHISLLCTYIFWNKSCNLIMEPHFTLLYCRAQNMADVLISHGWPTACIAGSHDQRDRNEAMSQLKTYKCRVLISTDLVSLLVIEQILVKYN